MSGQETHWQPRAAGYWLIWAGILKTKEKPRVQTRQAHAGSQLVGEQGVGGGKEEVRKRTWVDAFCLVEKETSSQSWPGSLASGSFQKQIMCISGADSVSQGFVSSPKGQCENLILFNNMYTKSPLSTFEDQRFPSLKFLYFHLLIVV